MALRLYNTMARGKEVFEPLVPGRVGMYVCGPTVYDRPHIGNARPIVVFDLLYRVLRRHFEHVTYVRNITDVDDKINAAAKANGEPIAALTERTIEAFHADIARLNVLEPDVEPRATQHIAEIIALIEKLIANGHAYAAEGHVLFDVTSMADYGALSGRNRDELLAGARVEVAGYKRDPGDFVLWKPSDADLPGWDSPWGRGRPGWHIECSAMSQAHLGRSFDIHGGGRDLVFPHHENEVAQSVCAHGQPFVRCWVHNGFVTVDGDKMSKSLGNFITLGEALERADGETIRLWMLGTHYRHPLDWTEDSLGQAKSKLDRLYTALRHLGGVAAVDEGPPDTVLAALDDDLNTPRALAAMHALAGAANKAVDGGERARLKGALLGGGAVLGLLHHGVESWFKGDADDGLDRAEIDRLIAARAAARQAKDYAESDRIRDRLAAAGIIVEDGSEGTSWRRAG